MKNRKKYILIGVIILIVLVIAIVSIILTNRKKDNNEKTSQVEIVDNIDISYSEVSKFDMSEGDNTSVSGNTKYNISDKINKTHYIGKTDDTQKQLVISDVSVYASDNQAYFIANVTNNDSDYEGLVIFIDFYSEKGDIIDSEMEYFDEFKFGETKKLELSSSIDFSNAYDVKIYY